MKRIGLLSDTHGTCDQKIFNFFKECDEIWHAGDIGTIDLADDFESFKPFRAVYGNIDNHQLRARYPETDIFNCEGVKVLMTHIGGYPGHYDQHIRNRLLHSPPRLFISGHSHILKVIPDAKLGLLHINPGAAGKNGFHQVRTAVRFEIDDGNISGLEILELKR